MRPPGGSAAGGGGRPFDRWRDPPEDGGTMLPRGEPTQFVGTPTSTAINEPTAVNASDIPRGPTHRKGWDADRDQRLGGTTSVGVEAPRYTLSATLPTMSRLKPSRAWVLIAIRSAPHRSASSRIAAAGDACRITDCVMSTVEGRRFREAS